MTLWETRDLPVLRSIAAFAESDDELRRRGVFGVGSGNAGEGLGLDLTDGEVHDALYTLADAGYVTFRVWMETGNSKHFLDLRVTGRGSQALGEWPFFTEMTPATLAALLERFADEAATEEESDNARKAASYIRSLSGTVVTTALRVAMVEGFKIAVGLPH